MMFVVGQRGGLTNWNHIKQIVYSLLREWERKQKIVAPKAQNRGGWYRDGDVDKGVAPTSILHQNLLEQIFHIIQMYTLNFHINSDLAM